jgi:hypothetical protein
MDATTVGVDLAKNVFEIALADERGHIVERQRLSRARFDRFFVNRPACRVVMEACGSAHHHARRLSSQGHEVVLLPAQYARAYVRRNKTDAADAAALIEAARCPDIRPVPVKSVDQQALQQLHRLRSQWMSARTARINFLRGVERNVKLTPWRIPKLTHPHPLVTVEFFSLEEAPGVELRGRYGDQDFASAGSFDPGDSSSDGRVAQHGAPASEGRERSDLWAARVAARQAGGAHRVHSRAS